MSGAAILVWMASSAGAAALAIYCKYLWDGRHACMDVHVAEADGSLRFVESKKPRRPQRLGPDGLRLVAPYIDRFMSAAGDVGSLGIGSVRHEGGLVLVRGHGHPPMLQVITREGRQDELQSFLYGLGLKPYEEGRGVWWELPVGADHVMSVCQAVLRQFMGVGELEELVIWTHEESSYSSGPALSTAH